MTRKAKTLAIYHELPEKFKKRWWSEKQCVLLDMHTLSTAEGRWKYLYKNKWIEKREMLVRTEQYDAHLRANPKKWYYGLRYQTELFFKADDVRKIVKNGGFKDRKPRKIAARTPQHAQESFRQLMADKRVFEYEDMVKPIIFYNDYKDSYIVDKSPAFELYYSMFGLNRIMNSMFSYNFGIDKKLIDFISYCVMFGFLTYTDLRNFDSKGLTRKGLSWVLKKSMKEGYIEEIEQRGKQINNLKVREKLYKPTDKGYKLFELYFECMTFKRKLEYKGSGFCDTRMIPDDVSPHRFDGFVASVGTGTYSMYEYMFDYINVTLKTEIISREELKEYMEHNQTLFAYNPMLYQMTCYKYTKNNGEIEDEYIKKFVERYGFGYDVT